MVVGNSFTCLNVAQNKLCRPVCFFTSLCSVEHFFFLQDYILTCLLFRQTWRNTCYGCKYLLIINICSLVSSWETCWLLLHHSLSGWHSLWNHHRVTVFTGTGYLELKQNNFGRYKKMCCCFFRVGQVVNITAKVNRAFTSSMEVCGNIYYLAKYIRI